MVLSQLGNLLEKVEEKADDLFNTVIRRIDYEISRILGIKDIVEIVRTLVIETARRKMSRALGPKPSALEDNHIAR